MKKGIFILTLLGLLAASPAMAGWYFNFGYSYYPLYYFRHGGVVFVSYPSQPIYRGYPLFPVSGFRPYGAESSMRTVERITAISEEKRMQWLASQTSQVSQEQKPTPGVESEYIPPVVEETPLEMPTVETNKSPEL